MIFKKENCLNISGTQEEQDNINLMYDIDNIVALSKLCKFYENIFNSSEEHFLYSKKEAEINFRIRLQELSSAVSNFNSDKRKAHKRFPDIVLEGSNLVNLFYFPE